MSLKRNPKTLDFNGYYYYNVHKSYLGIVGILLADWECST